MIPFFDNTRDKKLIEEELSAIRRAREKGNLILGEEVSLFENEFAEYLGRKYAVGTGNGHDALVLGLEALNVRGGEVITVPNTAFPTITAIFRAGAFPRFIDVREEDLLMDTEKLEQAINENTRAIVPVHLYGNVCDMNEIREILYIHNIFVLEDCCQAHGSCYKEERVPVSGLGAFSFYPTKNLGALGDAGMIVTDDEEIRDYSRKARAYGLKEGYDADFFGINSRLDELQAGVLRTRLRRLESWNKRRRDVADFYNRVFSDVPGIRIPEENAPNYHLYVIRTERRDELRAYLKERGIETKIHYSRCCHLTRACRNLGYKEGDFPVAEKAGGEILSLPCFPELREEEAIKVAETVKEFFS